LNNIGREYISGRSSLYAQIYWIDNSQRTIRWISILSTGSKNFVTRKVKFTCWYINDKFVFGNSFALFYYEVLAFQCSKYRGKRLDGL